MLDEKIGEGSFAVVYKGNLADGSPVAVKQLKIEKRKDVPLGDSAIEAFEEFRREIRIMKYVHLPWLICCCVYTNDVIKR